jgi:3-oxoacyl-[acyl-carrier protein] reductase
MLSIDLSGKVAVVTGANGELGRVMARRLGEAGADVALTYHRGSDVAEATAAEIRKMGRKSLVIKTDVTDRDSVNALAARVKSELGAASIIVNNANSGPPWKPILEHTPDDYRQQFESCVTHNLLMVQAFVPGMIEKKWGRVIGISTECVMQYNPTQSTYVAGKRAMDGMLRILTKEVGMHGITVNQVAPGWTISDRDRKPDGTVDPHPEYENHVPLKHRGTDVDIANSVVFLASDLAQFITGVYLPVCGGNVMPGV